MAGEAASWRRGREVCRRWEHQVHPPRSHPQADTQVIILNYAASPWWRGIQCNSRSPVNSPIRPPGHPSFPCINMMLFSLIFPFIFQPRPSQSRGCHGFYCAHDPAHLTHTESRGGPHPVHNGDVSLLLVGAWPLLPAWLKHSSGRNHSQRKPSSARPAPDWDLGWKLRLEEPTGWPDWLLMNCWLGFLLSKGSHDWPQLWRFVNCLTCTLVLR